MKTVILFSFLVYRLMGLPSINLVRLRNGTISSHISDQYQMIREGWDHKDCVAKGSPSRGET